MKKAVSVVLLLFTSAWGQSKDKAPPETSRCHIFIDNENIWTLEMVQSGSGERVPILNIVTLTAGKWDLRPGQIQIYNKQGKKTEIKKFSMDTGVPDEPYITEYLKVLGNSFIGIDLKANFEDFAEPSRVFIDLGDQRFELQPMDCLQFDMVAEKINNVNFDSPNVKEDFYILKIEHIGKKGPKPKGRR